ncbi:LCP family protein [Clostridium vitabionis]|uniref:LCP family protein n=1 Tax=Clostridium vitabionis TaxID=2784388 RepID=UPI001F405E3C|nr:LCP family protein [Clostridium vitabionis]
MMAYNDDELERMRARRRNRNSAGRTGTGRNSGSSDGSSGSRLHVAGRGASAGGGYPGGSRESRGRGAHSRKYGRRKRRVWLAVLEVFLVLALLIGAVCWYVYQRTFGAMQKIEFDENAVQNLDLSEQQLADMEGYFNIMCFGVDSRMENGVQNVGKGTNADVNMIISANLETGDIRIISVFRDSYLNVNDKNSYNKINAAYAQGGPEQAVKALNKNLGLNVTQYATFNWGSVAKAINILGGVDVDLSDAEFSWINAYITETVKETGIGSVQLTHSGHVHLDGIQAVAYARIRYSDTDYARTERQRIVLEKAFEKAKNADWGTLQNLIFTITPELATNVSVDDIVPLAKRITKFNISDTQGFPSARGEKRMDKLGDCVIPQTLAYNVKLLHQFLFDEQDYQVPNSIQEYSSHIASVTGLTTNAKVIGHVATDQGISADAFHRIMGSGSTSGKSSKKYDSLEPVTDPETKAKKKTEAYEYSTDSKGNAVYETDENGDVIFETEKNGKVVLPTDKSGKTEYPTDAHGDVIDPPEDDETEKAATKAAGPGSETNAHASVGPKTETEPKPAETKAEEPKAAEPAGPASDNSSNKSNQEAVGPGAEG